MHFSYFFLTSLTVRETCVLVFSFVVEHVFERNIFLQFIKRFMTHQKPYKQLTTF